MGYLVGLKEYLDKAYTNSIFDQVLDSRQPWRFHLHDYQNFTLDKVGGYDLGLDPNANPVHAANAAVIAYWGVDDIEEKYQRLLSIGAKEHSKIQHAGENIKVATVLDPFGNVFGIISLISKSSEEWSP